MYLKRFYDEEVWKEVALKTPFSERFRLYVSNYGQIKKYNTISNTEVILKQAKTEGYPSVNITFLPPIPENDQRYFEEIRTHIDALKKKIKATTKTTKSW